MKPYLCPSLVRCRRRCILLPCFAANHYSLHAPFHAPLLLLLSPHTHTAPPWVGSKSPLGWWLGCTSHPGVLGSIPKREEPGKTGRHPVLQYWVPHGSHGDSAAANAGVHPQPPAGSQDNRNGKFLLPQLDGLHLAFKRRQVSPSASSSSTFVSTTLGPNPCRPPTPP